MPSAMETPLESDHVAQDFESLKPLRLYGRGGPNPPKVAMVLEELGLPYAAELIPFDKLKQEPYTNVNPNGRIPALYDPNTDITIWESGAIILYLVDKYDSSNKVSFAHGSKEHYLAQQWLFFQVSGQGPYYGQSIYFTRYHSEPAPSTVDRFNREINRVTGVLEKWLSEQDAGSDGPWLVGGKFSYADLAFYPWQKNVPMFLKEAFDESAYPHVTGWIARLGQRRGIKKVWEDNERLMAEMMAKQSKQ